MVSYIKVFTDVSKNQSIIANNPLPALSDEAEKYICCIYHDAFDSE